MSSDFVLVSEALIEDRIGVKKFRSQKTGLSVVFVGVPGPAVNGYFCLATETDCDDGLPHTLEHLIFLGSDDYPFKGVLDSLANRCLAIGTNAWTATDHTCYTINCAGYEGFLNILPVYVDHILWATLTDDGFYTEVHHINEEGKDAGVVYCEMEGRENTMISRMYRRLHQLLFPDPSCYNKETGGICLNLRSLKVDKVRKYHEDYYKAPNLTLVITGQVPEDKVMEKLEEVQAKILRKAGERPQLLDFSRPWQTPIPDFPSSVLSTVEFPADDEDTGSVMVGWRTCSASDYDTIAALVVLREYLSDSVISPLQQEFVNIAEPLCSSLHFGDCSYSTIAIYLMFQAVPTAKLEFIREKLFEKLQKIHDSEGIDMERIQTVLKRTRLSHKETLEDSPHDTLAGMMIHEFLYGSRDPAEEGQQIASLTRLSERTIEFAAKDQSFWLGLLKRYFIDSPHAFVIGKPSTSLGEEMAKAEEKRIEAQREQIGEEGLAKLEEDLEGAMDRNDTPVPDEMIEKFQVPDTSKIPLIDITTVRDSEKIVSASKPANANADRLFDTLVADDNEPLPLFVQFDEIESEFVLINVFIDTTTLPQNLRQYLEIYLEAIFECPILRRNPDGTTSQISHEEVVKELNTHTVSYYNSLGFGGGNFSCGSFAQEACLSIKSEVSKYQENVRRLSEFLYDSLFTTERLLISAKKLDQNATDKRRKAAHVAGAMLRQINYSPVSNHHATISIRQQATLRRFIESFGTPEGSESILQELEQFRKELTHPSNLKVQVVGPIHKLTNPKKTWRSVFLPPTFAPFSRDELLNKRSATLSKSLKTEQSAGGQNVIAGLASVESCELYQTTNWDCDFKDLSKVAAMMVLLEYLTTMEGPFWKQIRGQGLSYGYNIHPNVETCLLTFSLSRSNSVIKAYQEAVSIINDFVSGEEEFEELYVEAARSSCIFATIDKEQTPSDAATQSFVGFLKGVETRALLHHIEKVQIADVTEALKSVSRLFDPALTNTSLVCNVSKVPEIVEGFRQEFGKNFTVIENLDEFFVSP